MSPISKPGLYSDELGLLAFHKKTKNENSYIKKIIADFCGRNDPYLFSISRIISSLDIRCYTFAPSIIRYADNFHKYILQSNKYLPTQYALMSPSSLNFSFEISSKILSDPACTKKQANLDLWLYAPKEIRRIIAPFYIFYNPCPAVSIEELNPLLFTKHYCSIKKLIQTRHNGATCSHCTTSKSWPASKAY